MKKVKVCLTLSSKIVDELKKVRDKTGLSIARQVELKLEGYIITKHKK